jgi:uncharacterized protein (TIGR00288 family)
MPSTGENNLALFIDFDNIALGSREMGQRFNIHPLIQRLLEKGKIIVKRAYADWSHHEEHMAGLHGAGIELIEIPKPQVSGKNSADIRLVVDAMDLCHGKSHLDTFVIVSGDSDFTPLVTKLRENNKSVIGVGVRNSTAQILVNNCDEFIFYDDLIKETTRREADALGTVPSEHRKLFDFVLTTTQGLMRDGRELLYGSLIKDTMKRKRPDFDEANYGYSTFGDLLEDAAAHGILEVERDQRAGGTWVVTGLGRTADRPGRRRRPPARPRSGAPQTTEEDQADRQSGRQRVTVLRRRSKKTAGGPPDRRVSRSE